MHRMTGREFFTEAGKTFLAGGSRKADYAYLCGFLCHFALDRACHGYINALAARGEVSHEEIESELDRILLKEDGSFKMIRRAETPADYFATFDFCDIMDKYLNK